MVLSNATIEGIIRYIKENKLKVGDKLPSENILTKEFNISRLTLRESLKQMKGEGIVCTIHGKGSYISSDITHIRDTIDRNLSITEMIISAGYKPGISFFQRNIVSANEEVAKYLNIKEGADVLVCKRVRTADKNPVVYSIDYFASILVPGFLNIANKNVSIYNYIEIENNIRIENSFAEIIPFKCNKEISKKLNYPLNESMFVIKQTIKDSLSNPLIYSIEYLRPDYFKIFVNRRRG